MILPQNLIPHDMDSMSHLDSNNGHTYSVAYGTEDFVQFVSIENEESHNPKTIRII